MEVGAGAETGMRGGEGRLLLLMHDFRKFNLFFVFCKNSAVGLMVRIVWYYSLLPFPALYIKINQVLSENSYLK